jgi:predicted N-acetyltransferase YhbS
MTIEFENALPAPEEYILLRSAVGWNLIDENAMVKGVRASTYSVLAKSEGKTVGMGRIVGDGGIIFLLADVIVIPEFQGKGIGKEIMNRIMNWIKTNGAKGSLIWLFAAEGREGFYEKFGFEKRPADGKGAGMQWVWRE